MDEGSSAPNVDADADAFGHRQSQRRERPTLHWIKRCKNATCGRGCRDNKTDKGNTRWHTLQVRIGLEALGAFSPLRQVIRAACRAAGAGGEAKAISRARKYSLGSSVVQYVGRCVVFLAITAAAADGYERTRRLLTWLDNVIIGRRRGEARERRRRLCKPGRPDWRDRATSRTAKEGKMFYSRFCTPSSSSTTPPLPRDRNAVAAVGSVLSKRQ